MLHPDFGGGGAYGIPFIVVPPKQNAGADPLHRVRRRERSRSVPDPAERAGRGRHRRATATATCSSCSRARVTSTSSYDAFWRGNHWDADVGRELEPDVEHAAPARAGRRPTRPACRSFPASCATTRSRPARSTTRCASRSRRRRRATSSRRRTTRRRRPTRRCPPMGLRLRLKASFSLTRFHGESLVILQALKTLRDDRRRQRLVVVHHRRRRSRAGTTTTSTS